MEEICRPLFVENFFSIKLLVIDWTNFSAKPFVHLSIIWILQFVMLVRRQNVCIELNMCLVDSDSIFSYKKNRADYTVAKVKVAGASFG